MSRSRSRSRNGSNNENSEGLTGWNDQKNTLFHELAEHFPEESDDLISETVQRLANNGCDSTYKIRNCPPEVFNVYLPPTSHGRHLILVHCLKNKLCDDDKGRDPMVQATKAWAREAKAQRQNRTGREAE